MKTPAPSQLAPNGLPVLHSQALGWENILVQQFQHPPGEESYHYSDEHAICMSLSPRPVRLLQIREGKTYEGLYGKGDVSITPAKVPFLPVGTARIIICEFALHLVSYKALPEKHWP
jgi:AraC family transcriptional regulator